MRRLAFVLVVLTLLPACAVSGLGFSNDHRVDIVAPDNRAKVDLPVTIKWRAPGITHAADGTPFFVVFLDRAPIRPGQTLRAVADDSCNRTPGCPDLAYLRDRYVFVTKKTSLTLAVVPKPTGQRTGAKESHEATIVLVNADGRRIGEAAYTVDFTVKSR
ncbi:MAG TPA: hypothetical protein VHC63_02280 [Acidimicrobiales bacterium]|nr:hypothetical protein [Acidimicrobiales bacterium]